jgi:phosphate transport system protein
VVLDFFKRGRGSALDDVERMLVQMLRDGRAVYDAATAAVFGGGTSKDTKRRVKGTDREINAAQRQVRRALVVHASVTGSPDLALAMAYMSVVKDVERVGDYAKSLYDIARYGADFSQADDREELERYCAAVGNLLDEAAMVFEERDTERALQLVTKADTFIDEYDEHVRAAAQSEGSALVAVTRALYYFYLARITAHVMNLMTSLVLPVDQLDYYDEAKDDRGEVDS